MSTRMKKTIKSNHRIEHRRSQEREKNKPRRKTSRRRLDQAQLKALLAMYSNPRFTTAEIANRFGVLKGSVTYAAKRAGLLLRKRGCRRHPAPSPATQAILLDAWIDTYENVASRHGVTKQRIAIIVARWKHWALAQFGPREIRTPKLLVCEQNHCPRDPFATGPHVISFRIPESVFVVLKKRSATECPTRRLTQPPAR
jgi:hypothetical protein